MTRLIAIIGFVPLRSIAMLVSDVSDGLEESVPPLAGLGQADVVDCINRQLHS